MAEAQLWGKGQAMVSNLKVLVVDDEEALRFPIVEVLSDAGLRVLEATNADDAIARINEDASIRSVFF